MARGVVRPTLLREQLPAEGRYHESTSDAHNGQLDAEHFQHPGAEYHRTEQQHETVDCNLASQAATLLTREARGQAKEEGCPFDRVDDGKKSSERQQEGAGNRAHFAGARNSMRAIQRIGDEYECQDLYCHRDCVTLRLPSGATQAFRLVAEDEADATS